MGLYVPSMQSECAVHQTSSPSASFCSNSGTSYSDTSVRTASSETFFSLKRSPESHLIFRVRECLPAPFNRLKVQYTSHVDFA